MKVRLSWNVKLSKAKQETNVCSANHFLLKALCVTWCMKSSLFSLKQIEIIRGGRNNTDPKTVEVMFSARTLSFCRKGGCEGLRVCVEGKPLKAIFLTGWMWKAPGRKKKKKAAQNCHLSIASCSCSSSSSLTVILRPSLASKISSFLFLVVEYGFRSAEPTPLIMRAPKRVWLLFSVAISSLYFQHLQMIF